MAELTGKGSCSPSHPQGHGRVNASLQALPARTCSGWRERRSEAPESFDAPALQGRKHFDANRCLTAPNPA